MKAYAGSRQIYKLCKKIIKGLCRLRKKLYVTHRKIFFSESQLSPIVKSNLVEITRIPVLENHVNTVKKTNISLVTEKKRILVLLTIKLN